MKRTQILLICIFMVAVLIISTTTVNSSEKNPKANPWYLKLDFIVKFNGQNHPIRYDLNGQRPLGVSFYDPYTSKLLTDEDVAAYTVGTPEQEKYFMEFLYKETYYPVDTDGDGTPDVLHIIKYMPTRYIKDEVAKDYMSQAGGLKGLLDVLRMRLEENKNFDDITFQEKAQILVTVKADLPPYDGKPDVMIFDNRNPHKDPKRAFGGDGKIDEVKPIQNQKATTASFEL